MAPDPIEQVTRLFDAVAPTYDQVGVDFFGPIAQRLIALLEPRAGERAVDLGCGRGAATLPLAAAVGSGGEVRAYDLSPAMADSAREATRHLPQVRVEQMNAAQPDIPPASADVVAASLVLFFLPDPAAALSRWIELLSPGGRIGLTTFGPQDETWTAIDQLFDPYLPPAMLDARTSGTRGPFATNASFDALVLASGAASVETSTQPQSLAFADVEQWHRWTMSVGQRMMWSFVPDDEKPRILAQASEMLDGARNADGMTTLRQDVRYSIGRVS